MEQDRVRRVRCTDQRGAHTHLSVVVHHGHLHLHVDGSAVSLDEDGVRELLTWVGEGQYRLMHGHYWRGPDAP